MRNLKFRAWIEPQKYMAIQGNPDLETLASFMHHYSNEKNLMQSSEMFDMNDNEIFEGDIIEFEGYGDNKTIIFKNGAFGYIADEGYFISLDETNLSIAKIIENIYQYNK